MAIRGLVGLSLSDCSCLSATATRLWLRRRGVVGVDERLGCCGSARGLNKSLLVSIIPSELLSWRCGCMICSLLSPYLCFEAGSSKVSTCICLLTCTIANNFPWIYAVCPSCL